MLETPQAGRANPSIQLATTAPLLVTIFLSLPYLPSCLPTFRTAQRGVTSKSNTDRMAASPSSFRAGGSVVGLVAVQFPAGAAERMVAVVGVSPMHPGRHLLSYDDL